MNEYLVIITVNDKVVHEARYAAILPTDAKDIADAEISHITNENRKTHIFLVSDDVELLNKKVQNLKNNLKKQIKHPWKQTF